MPNVAELIKDHVTLTVDCVDRPHRREKGPGRLVTPQAIEAE